MSLVQLLSIMLGGALGAITRYLLSNLVYDWLGRDFPYGTLTVNVIGSFLMGLLTIFFLQKGNIDPAMRLGLLVGFVGALTTFSTFSLDTLVLIQEGVLFRAMLNVLLSVVVCVIAVWFGMITARQF
ncbi:MAG: fluoride efflux transporter CrcB [Thiotrichaceae bacterium]